MKQKIYQLMTEQNISFNELAAKLKVSKQTITRKINGATDWTYSEIMILTELFNIKDPKSFFFDEN
jgi:plasmid maintenance system antidote protein VapI